MRSTRSSRSLSQTSCGARPHRRGRWRCRSLDRCRQADAGPGAPAVEVGGDDEFRRGPGDRVGHPRRRARAQLELSGPSRGRQPVGIPGEQQAPGCVRGRPPSVEPRHLPAGRGRLPARASAQRAPIRPLIVTCPATSATRSPRSAGSSSGRPRRTCRARRRARRRRTRSTVPSATHAGQAGCSGRSTIRRPTAVSHPSSSIAPSSRSSSSASFHARGGGGSGNASLLDRGAPRRHLQGEAGQIDRGDLGGAVGRAGCRARAWTTAGTRRPVRCVRRDRRAGRRRRG